MSSNTSSFSHKQREVKQFNEFNAEGVLSLEDPLERKLLELKKEIELRFPDVPYDRHLLRQEILKILVEESPDSLEAFHEAIPNYLLAKTNLEEAKFYVPKILKLIKEFG